MFDCLIPEIASLICFITWYCFDFSSGDCVVSSDLCCWRCSGSRHCNWVCVGHLHSLRAAAEATSTTRSGRPSWAGFQLEKKKKLLPLSPLSPLSSRPSSSISSLSKSVANFGGKREFSSSSSSSRLLSSITLHMIDWLMIAGASALSSGKYLKLSPSLWTVRFFPMDFCWPQPWALTTLFSSYLLL